MKKKLQNLICFLIACALLVVALFYLTNLFERKNAVIQYTDFFEEEEDFNVLFLGTSHVLSSVFPMELWKDYGIVSYNMGGNGNPLANTYWVMENALDYTTPDLVVIDGLKLRQDFKTSKKYSQTHVSLDAFPLTKNKIAAAKDLLSEDEILWHIENDDPMMNKERRDILGLLWDFSVYHARWEELEEQDFNWTPSPEKGAQGRIWVSEAQEVTIANPEDRYENTLGMYYLERMIEECQEREIEVLLVYLPFPASKAEQIESYTMEDIAKKWGVNYINFLEEDVINYDTDLSDADSHLNFSGGRKVTDYLGQYIREYYAIPDQRNNPDYANWNEDYVEYRDYKISRMNDVEYLNSFLMLMADKNFDCLIEVNNDRMLIDTELRSLFVNLGIDVKKLMSGAKYFYVTSGGENVETFTTNSQGKELLTEKGTRTFKPNEEADIRVTVYDSESGEEVCAREFTYEEE